MKIRPPIKTHGGKFYLCDWIISLFPENYEKLIYVEPYLGGGSVFLNKNPGKSSAEFINDLDLGVVAIFRTLQNKPDEFIKRLKGLTYSEDTFEMAKLCRGLGDLELAINEFTLRRMSRGGLKKDFAWSERLRGGKPGDINAWETAIEQLPLVAARVKNHCVLSGRALNIIKNVGHTKRTLLYLDPPYLAETRQTLTAYEHEMHKIDHIELAEVLWSLKGKWLISGYESELYKELYKDAVCFKKEITNHSSQQKVKKKKIECVWRNF